MGKFDNYIILSDLDHTFIAEDGSVPQRNIDAIKYFNANGGKFAFSSGRRHDTLMNAVPIAPELASGLCVFSNGCYLYDYHDKKIINPTFIDKEIALKIARYILVYDPSLGIRLTTLPGVVVSVMDDYIKAECNPSILKSYAVQKPEDWTADDWFKIVVRGDHEKLVALDKALKEKFGDVVEYTTSGVDYYEIQNKNCSKGTGLSAVREYYASLGKKVKIYACGDFDNDLSMLRVADVAVCPSNACKNVKDVADLCLCSNNDGVIAEIIESIDAEVSAK